MGGDKKSWRAPSATPWDDVPKHEVTPAQFLVARSHKSIYEFRHESFSGDIAFLNAYQRRKCPSCAGRAVKDGHDGAGLQRYRCTSCGMSFNPATGTIFENRKLPISAWADFMLQALSYESINAMTREDRRSDTTVPYWMSKLFAVLEGIQDDTVLSGRVWLDETFWPVAKEDRIRKPDGTFPRGLSRNLICIGLAIDDSGKVYAKREGFGKPSQKTTWEAFGAHIEPGSRLIHDMEKSHKVLVTKLGLESEVHNSALLKGIPDKDNPLERVNTMCFLLKRFLRSHSGFNRDSLQGYLDLFSVAVNPPTDKLEKVANLLDRAMRYPNTLRFRDFYNVKSSSMD